MKEGEKLAGPRELKNGSLYVGVMERELGKLVVINISEPATIVSALYFSRDSVDAHLRSEHG